MIYEKDYQTKIATGHLSDGMGHKMCKYSAFVSAICL